MKMTDADIYEIAKKHFYTERGMTAVNYLTFARELLTKETEDQCSRCGGADFMACGCTPAQQLAAAAPAQGPFGFVDADGLFYYTITGQEPKPGCTAVYRATQRQVSAPAGWKLVPTDMTDAMRKAAAGWSDHPDACYAAALLAAPK
jgi:hypothetical protein